MAERIAISKLMPGFRWLDVDVNGVRIHTAVAGSGPPLLLLHGYPETHLTWHKVAPKLAERFTVVAPDLRGYGDSDKPEGGEKQINYSKRVMAKDQVALMAHFGHEEFSVLSHDRGARVAHRLALDHPQRLRRLVILDIIPTATHYATTNREFATRYFWWFFLIQPFDLPEHLIGCDSDYFLAKQFDVLVKLPGAIDPIVMEEYRRCFGNPALHHATCEDFRASAGIDLEHDTADAEMRIESPLMVLWGARGVLGQLYDVLATWREKTANRVHGYAIDCGHCIQEERPEELLTAVVPFLTS